MGYKPHRICCSHPDQISLKGALGTNIERKKNNKKVIIVKIKAIKTNLLTNSSGLDRLFSLFLVNLTFNNPFMLIPLKETIYSPPSNDDRKHNERIFASEECKHKETAARNNFPRRGFIKV